MVSFNPCITSLDSPLSYSKSCYVQSIVCLFSTLHIQHDDSLEKLSDVTEQIVLELTDSCECALTVEYIADGRLVCDPNEPENVIFQGRIISTSERNSTDFLPMLGSWVLNEATIVVQGVQLKVESRCSVELANLGDTECVQPPTDSVIGPGFPVPGVAGAVGGVLVLVVLAVIIVGAIICVQKLRRGKGKEYTMKPKEKETV